MDQNKLKCMCGETFTQNDFTKHFGGCQQFKAEFKEFDSKFGELLKAYSEPKEKLLIVRFLLKLYITVIEKKLKKYYDSINRENPGGVNNMNPPPVHFPNPANENNNNMNNNSNNNASQILFNKESLIKADPLSKWDFLIQSISQEMLIPLE